MAICVVTESQTECQSFEANITCRLSNLSQIEWKREFCVSIRLTKGIHLLSELLNFSKVTNLEIHGESSRNLSSVLCNDTGIRFEDISVMIVNVVFDNCGYLQTLTDEGMILTALNFDKSCAQLENVALINSKGLAVYTYNGNMTLTGCNFQQSTGGHVKINFRNKGGHWFVNIFKTQFYKGSSANGSGGLEIKSSHSSSILKICLYKSNFSANKGGNSRGSHLFIEIPDNYGTDVNFTDCEFSDGRGDFGVLLKSKRPDTKNTMKVMLSRCKFINNDIGGLRIDHVQYVEIDTSWVYNNTRGIDIQKRSTTTQPNKTVTIISNTQFSNNSEALCLNITLFREKKASQETQIRNCTFSSHNSSSVLCIKGDPIKRYQGNKVHLQGLNFEGNYNVHGNVCSALLLRNLNNVLLEELSFLNNRCTGITLVSSIVTIQGSLNLTGNAALSGGGLKLVRSKATINIPSVNFSRMILDRDCKINIINNTASRYGGGIFTDQTCNESPNCFFEFIGGGIPESTVFNLKGNWAELGGDSIFGGCLSNCRIIVGQEQADQRNRHFIDYLPVNKSLSTIADYPTKVVFCSPRTSDCAANYTLSAYRGEQFNISLMAVDDSCIPSVAFIESKAKEIGGVESYKKTKKYCDAYSYSVKGSPKDSVAIELFLHRERSSPAALNVVFSNCPIGFELNNNSEQCVCKELLKSKHVECITSTGSLKVPAFTWIGNIGGREAIIENCQYCHKGIDVIIEDTRNGSQKLCFSPKRTGVLCGKCIAGYSLQLGGYSCAECSNSAYIKGISLVLGSVIIGVATVILLLSLNLTVSIGLVNGLIFYSNVVHYNSDVFLPIDSTSNSTLNTVVRFLSAFQAWINLDFGIVTCFFNGYDTYTSAWIQFVFPLYIWLLILIIVLASRYSKRISTIITSNIVSVLATLLLLSYAKLLKTSIEGISYTDAEFLNDSSKYRVWILDGNIPYLQGKHIPLFLMSLVTIVAYIVPFTLLILLGPLLQAKSHFRILRWVNKLKPFLDAFYGSYTSSYRYWPGILLLARMGILVTYAVYSLGDSPFKLMTVSVVVAVLLVVWMLIGKTRSTSLYQKRHLNYIELFFLLNLAIFTVTSIYHFHVTKSTWNQQSLAVGMVGSVLVASCSILVYQIFIILSRYKALQKIIQFFSHKITFVAARKDTQVQNFPLSQNETASNSPTHSSVEITDPNSILREPLLTN